ncbi:hypothetical protein LY78DRAFT_144065 [Colletotrichum sublineola]|nr:hypothetical protein LY78DRAFT_144065 [Colletotrichum sublineola]
MASILTDAHLGIHHLHLGQEQRRSVPGRRWPGHRQACCGSTKHMMIARRGTITRGAVTPTFRLLPLLFSSPTPRLPPASPNRLVAVATFEPSSRGPTHRKSATPRVQMSAGRTLLSASPRRKRRGRSRSSGPSRRWGGRWVRETRHPSVQVHRLSRVADVDEMILKTFSRQERLKPASKAEQKERYGRRWKEEVFEREQKSIE